MTPKRAAISALTAVLVVVGITMGAVHATTEDTSKSPKQTSCSAKPVKSGTHSEHRIMVVCIAPRPPKATVTQTVTANGHGHGHGHGHRHSHGHGHRHAVVEPARQSDAHAKRIADAQQHAHSHAHADADSHGHGFSDRHSWLCLHVVERARRVRRPGRLFPRHLPTPGRTHQQAAWRPTRVPARSTRPTS